MSDTPVERRTWLPIAVALTLVAAVMAVIVLGRGGSSVDCASAAAEESPLLSTAELEARPDPRLERLRAAVDRMGAPFGPVRAGLGYDYDQFLHLYGVGDGLLAFTKDNAPVTLLDAASLKPRWSLRPATKRIAWDASADLFLLLDLSAKSRTRIAAFDLATGEERWCKVASAAHEDGEPVATTFLPGGDVVVALPDDEDGLIAYRIRTKDGSVLWSGQVEDAARGDFLGALDDDTVIIGGVEEHRLAQADSADPAAPAGAVLTAVDTEGDEEDRTFSARKGESVHVAGIHGDQVLVVKASASGSRLVSLDGSLDPQWEISPAGGAVESTLRGDVLLMRSRTALTGYDAGTGKVLWTRPVPTGRTYFPYGFTLGQMPSLDSTHVLVPTTDALRVLDLTTGDDKAYPLPTDGVSTTYWPYQLAVTDSSIGIVTNTGTVVTSR